MGVRNLKPARVYQTAAATINASRGVQPPPWFSTIESIPPSEILTRPQPAVQRGKIIRNSKSRKPSKSFQPLQIVYYEDRLRKAFYSDHPWELARPRILLENDGRDAQRCNWQNIQQPGFPLTGESVVQRQLYLMDVEGKQKMEAYDIARKEFYALRHEEEVERRVAKEEALWSGAYFGKGPLEVGMELEDKVYEEWKDWALIQAERLDLTRQITVNRPAEDAVEPEEENEVGTIVDLGPIEGLDAGAGGETDPRFATVL
ncbi:37S ribosomal protein S25, mitochondrial [Amylocarpus encephaloides]|uniref:37S ribosomal protein S25, mitochondrial n=1 Tax=Amylocarpus encephaloides TaxID=45428 RepID=A0A9P7YSG8_9HELO|nr:37S ribosomal protein S25, mitochondrial [Amylocarpus encephaloides]